MEIKQPVTKDRIQHLRDWKEYEMKVSKGIDSDIEYEFTNEEIREISKSIRMFLNSKAEGYD